jgi:NSS family neurotransmitter:Na+ symporter
MHRKKATGLVAIIMLVLGSLSSLGYSGLSFVHIFGMEILDFFDFLTNSLMMPIAAFATCMFIVKCVGINNITEEVRISSKFRFEGMYRLFIKSVAPVFVVVILLSSLASVFGILNI